jgi:hypothetical protein
MIVAGIVGAMLLSGEAAAQCTSFTTLQNGSTADANQVNGNFSYLAGCFSNSPSFFGNVSIENSGVTVANPYAFLNFQNSSSPTPGAANMIRLWDNSTATATYGFGISAGQLSVISHANTTFYNGAVGNEVMRITTAGAVGIGTSTPAGTLAVQSANGDIVLNGTGTGGLNSAGSILFDSQGTWLWHLFTASNQSFYLSGSAGTNMYVAPGTNSWAPPSDVRLKTNIQTLPILDRLQNYRAVSFNWKSSGKHDIGVIAQELYKIFPEVVNKGSEGVLSGPSDLGTWSVQYDKLGALALEAAKELKAENDVLQAANKKEQGEVTALIGAVGKQQEEIAALKAQVALLSHKRMVASNR